MKKFLLSGINLIIIVIFIVFFRSGLIVALSMAPVIFVISRLNYMFADSTKTFLKYNIFLTICTVIGIVMNSMLYSRCVSYDSLSEAAALAGIIVSVLCIGILTMLELWLKNKKSNYRYKILLVYSSLTVKKK